jgi:UDP-3-O-[3-hydroxymyristoyl] glucosamine N-acyltransferase
MNSITLRQAIDRLSSENLQFEFSGNENTPIYQATPIDAARDGSISFLRSGDFSKFLAGVTDRNVYILPESLRSQNLPNGNFIFSNNQEVCFYIIAAELKEAVKPTLHATAAISSEAVIGNNVSIGAFTYIGPNSVVGDGSIIEHGCVIDNTHIGFNSRIQSGVKIGSDALGSLKDPSGKFRIRPHFGLVIIGRHVRIEDNVVINRGYLRNTIISDGVQIGPLSCLGNGVEIGENCLLAQGVTVAGSVNIGRDSYIWGSASVREGVSIGEGATVGMGSVILSNVPDHELWLGSPAKKYVRRQTCNLSTAND